MSCCCCCCCCFLARLAQDWPSGVGATGPAGSAVNHSNNTFSLFVFHGIKFAKFIGPSFGLPESSFRENSPRQFIITFSWRCRVSWSQHEHWCMKTGDDCQVYRHIKDASCLKANLGCDLCSIIYIYVCPHSTETWRNVILHRYTLFLEGIGRPFILTISDLNLL